MQAAVITENGLEMQDVAQPQPGAGEVLVRVKAAGLNRADLMALQGARGFAAGGVGGREFSGEIAALGDGVTGLSVGDRVMCTGNGAYAEYAVTVPARAWKVPGNNMSLEQAATLPVSLQTMHNAIVTAGRMEKSDAVLIQGASSGVGILGMQIAKHMGARLVIGTSTHEGRRAKLTEYGADMALDSSSPDWADQVLEATDGKGVDLIVDQVSGGVMNDNLKATRILGRIVNVGRLGGFKGELDFDLHALRRIDYTGVTFRTRSEEEVAEIIDAMKADLWGAVEAGELSIPIDKAFPLEQAGEAHQYMKDNQHFGKILLTA